MTILQTFRIAILAIRRNTMRSFLTILGVIIGVSAVIAMVAIGEGAKAMVEQAFASMGSNIVMIMPGSTTSGGLQGGFGSMPTLTWDDFEAIRKDVPTVRYCTPILRTAAPVIAEDQNWTTAVHGVSPDFFRIRNWEVSRGELFTDSDIESGRKVVVLGQTVVDKLYGTTADAVGRTVRIKKIPYLIIGVLERKGQSPMGQDYDDLVAMPYSVYQTKIQGGMQQYIQGVIQVGAVSMEATRRAEKQLTELLRERHHLQEGEDSDFSIRNLTEMANAQQSGTKTLTTLLAAIAAVSLLVGGIGIMNIMLVSVTERTREIGLRMAVGARPSDILAQFLVEALTLSMSGGVVGVILGLLAAQFLSSRFNWPLLIRTDIVVLSLGFSALVGILFGLYPARKASKLDPIEALRYE